MIERFSLNNLLGHLEVHSHAMKKVAWLSWLGSALPISNWPWLVSPPATPKTPGQSTALVTSNRHAKPLGGPKNAYTQNRLCRRLRCNRTQHRDAFCIPARMHGLSRRAALQGVLHVPWGWFLRAILRQWVCLQYGDHDGGCLAFDRDGGGRGTTFSAGC